MNLKEMSLKLYPGMMVVWPASGIMEPLDMSLFIRPFGKRKVYSVGVNNKAICYLYGGEAYATPWTREAIAILNDGGYQKERFYVPFDAGDVPGKERDTWEVFVLEAEASYRDDFTIDCLQWASKLGVRHLPRRVMRNCFEIPADGINVCRGSFREHLKPILNQSKPNPLTSSYVGRYSFNKGLVIFVDNNGRTWVAKGYGIIRRLKRAGYRDTGMFIPFSDGSLPVDKELCAQWITLPRVD